MTDTEIDAEEAGERKPRKKKKRRRADEQHYSEPYDWRDRERETRRWTSGQLFMALAVGLALGAVTGYGARGGGQTAAAPQMETPPAGDTVEGPRAAAPAAAPGGTVDKFGRAPGDEHFGHDHPPGQQGAAPAAPAATGPDGKDSFGRSPGQEHFGHNHP